MDEGTQSVSEIELLVASSGSHELNTRVARKRNSVQKEVTQLATTPSSPQSSHSFSPNW